MQNFFLPLIHYHKDCYVLTFLQKHFLQIMDWKSRLLLADEQWHDMTSPYSLWPSPLPQFPDSLLVVLNCTM